MHPFSSLPVHAVSLSLCVPSLVQHVQVVIAPATLASSTTLAPMTLTLALTTAPNESVQVSITAPTASWNPSQALAAITPSTVVFTGADWSSPQGISIAPANFSVGDWFLNVSFR